MVSLAILVLLCLSYHYQGYFANLQYNYEKFESINCDYYKKHQLNEF